MKLQDFFKKRGFRGTKFLPIGALSPFASSLTQEQEGRQFFWADTKIKGHFWLHNLRERAFYISKRNSSQPQLHPPAGAEQQGWWAHWEIGEAGDRPYLDVPVITWPENGGDSVFPVNCSRQEMLRSGNPASFSLSGLLCPQKVGWSWCGFRRMGCGRSDCSGECCFHRLGFCSWEAGGGEGRGWQECRALPSPSKVTAGSCISLCIISYWKGLWSCTYLLPLPRWAGN